MIKPIRKFWIRLLRYLSRRKKPKIIIIYPTKPEGRKTPEKEFALRGYKAIDFKLTSDELNSYL